MHSKNSTLLLIDQNVISIKTIWDPNHSVNMIHRKWERPSTNTIRKVEIRVGKPLMIVEYYTVAIVLVML